MNIYITRHGQTKWNALYKWQGSTDIPLDETGLAQARALAERVSPLFIGHIYASPLERAAVTAEICAEALGAEVLYMDELKEIFLGPWEGKTTQEIIRDYPKEFEIWGANQSAQSGLDWETYFDVQIRAYEAIIKIAESRHENILVVSHGAWIRALFCKFLCINLKDRMCFQTGNTGLSLVEYKLVEGEKRFTVVTLNDMSHIKNSLEFM